MLGAGRCGSFRCLGIDTLPCLQIGQWVELGILLHRMNAKSGSLKVWRSAASTQVKSPFGCQKLAFIPSFVFHPISCFFSQQNIPQITCSFYFSCPLFLSSSLLPFSSSLSTTPRLIPVRLLFLHPHKTALVKVTQ